MFWGDFRVIGELLCEPCGHSLGVEWPISGRGGGGGWRLLS